MKLLMISGDRSLAAGKQGAFFQTLTVLSAHFERIDIICPRATSAEEQVFFGNVFVHPSPWSLPLQPFWISRQGRQLHAIHHFDVMTVHEFPPFYNGIGARKLYSRLHIPYALEIHHIVGFPLAASPSEWIGRLLSRFYLPGACRKANSVRTVNAEVKHVLEEWGAPSDRIKLVPSFYLDVDLLSPATKEPTVDAVFCGRLVANKGLMEFVSAIERLRTMTATVIGDGPERARAEAFCNDRGFGNRVRFVGWLPTATAVIDTMRSAKVFVLCSKSEGGPRVALEAMACAMPVLTTRVGVLPDVIRDGENGVFTTGTPDDIAMNLQLLLADGAMRARLGTAARAAVLPRFERTTAIAAYAQFLQSIR